MSLEVGQGTTTFNFGARQYCIWPEFQSTILAAKGLGPQAYLPATVLSWHEQVLGESNLSVLLDHFANHDDVWDPVFDGTIIIQAPSSCRVTLDESRHVIVADSATQRLPNGPYVIEACTGRITSIASLLEDTANSFVGGAVIRDYSSDRFRWLYLNRIAVPSRLYYTKSETKPLAGLRFGVKDLIDIAGLETGCGNRCYRAFYPPVKASAPFVGRLLDLGAVLVGKTNTTQFADGEDPTERIDCATPFNPRGDGYQAPSSSSTGSATGCAAYSWLDFSIGTDTGGSIRHPAGVNGVYGIRPTLGSVQSSGLVVTPLMDTVGMFSRSAMMLETLGEAIIAKSLSGAPRDARPRYKLLFPVQSDKSTRMTSSTKWFPDKSDSGPSSDPHQQACRLFENITAALEQRLSCSRTRFSLEDLWASTTPSGLPKDIAEANKTVYPILVYNTIWRDVIRAFNQDYKKANGGRLPFLQPNFKNRLEYAAKATDQEVKEAVETFHSFADWIRDVLFASEEGEVPIMIFPQSWGVPSYIDQMKDKDAPLFWSGFSVYSISYSSGCPDITVPIGEVPFHSRITEQEEWLPVSVSILSKPGNDHMLLKLLHELELEGSLSAVGSGRRLYEEKQAPRVASRKMAAQL